MQESCVHTPLLPVEACVGHRVSGLGARASRIPPANAPCIRQSGGPPAQGCQHAPFFARKRRGRPVPARCLSDCTVLPMTHPDAKAEAICWNDAGELLAVGSNEDVRRIAAANGIQDEPRPGFTITPGFVDAHMHFFHVGVRRIRPDLRDAPSLEAALAIVADWMQQHPSSDPVIAEGWDESRWPERRFPTREEVSSLEEAGGRPVVLRRMCGHFAVAGDAALPPIRAHWDDDELVDLRSGILKEQPSLYLNEVVPVPADQLDQALQVATDIAHRLGVTTVGEYTQAPFREALLRAADADQLRIRIANHIYVQQLETAIEAGFRTGTPRGSGMLRDGGLKVFHDGSIGGRTALMREPFLDDPNHPNNRGTAIWTDAEVDSWYQDAHAAGIQVTAHVIGDAAIDQGLDGYTRLRNACQDQGDGPLPAWDDNSLRHRFEHYELPHNDAVHRTAELGIVACSQPNFIGEWSAKGGMYETRLGERYLLNNRIKTYLDAGVPLCFGSDGMPFGPLYGIECAMNHPVPSERLTAQQSIWLYTARAAWACHWDDTVGTLEPGKQADCLLIDGSLDAPATQWRVAETVLAGQTVAQNQSPQPHADALQA